MDILNKLGLWNINYQGKKVPTGAGFIYIFGLIITYIIYLLFAIANQEIVVQLLFLVSLIGSVSLIDDMVGKKNFQGFAGHFRQLFKGNLTTGALKAIVSFFSVLLVLEKKSSLDFFIDLGLILLMTNLMNLLDLRPGRALKFFFLLLFFLLLLIPSYLIYILPICLISVIYLPYELDSKVMLGDSGANVLGVVLGYGYRLALSIYAKSVVLVFLISLTILAEKYSFSKIILNNKIMRWFDKLGR